MPMVHFGGASYSPHRPFHNRQGNPARATIAEKERAFTAAEMYANGATWQAVADELGYAHRASAYNAALRFLARHQPLPQPSNHRRQEVAAMLRADGWTWQEVADELGYATRSGAYRAAEYAMGRLQSRWTTTR